jgi:ribonucleotide monophosphatase NagD (HAD superfamily)
MLDKLGSEVIYTGKPYPEIYDLALAQFSGFNKNRILMIGDTFETDILGANNAGIHSALVLSGNAQKFHKQADEIEKKLTLLQEAAAKLNAVPNFVITIA